jgi:hypothetical protein
MATKKLPDFPARATLPNYGAAVAFTPDGSRLLALDSSKVFAIERGTKDLLGFADLGCYGHSLAVGGDVIALATMNGVELYDLEGHARQSLALAAERPEGGPAM